MKKTLKIKKWQLLRFRSREEAVDLTDAEFIAVGKHAFLGQKRIENLVLPSTASAIKTEGFRGCKRLRSITLSENGNTGVASRAFAKCTRLHTVEHADLISSVGAQAFLGCRTLENITFGRELRKIGEEAFRGCESLTKLTLPSCLQTVGRAAFADCTELARVEMESGFHTLAPDQFRNCISLSEVEFSNTLREIPQNTFRNCSALTELTVPSNVQKVGKRAFFGCARLSSVELEMGVTHVGARAFANAPRLCEVVIPHTLKRLGFGAFGLGSSKEKILVYVDNEYMLRRMRRLLFLCGSSGRVTVSLVGKSLEERKRERRRATVDQKPVHLLEQNETVSMDTNTSEKDLTIEHEDD